jgi:hypothetical protein
MVRTGDKKVFCLGDCQNCVNCNGAMEVLDQVPHRTTYGQNNWGVAHETPAEWLPVRCKMNRLARAIGWDCRACARNFSQQPSEVNTLCEPVIADTSVKCLTHSAQMSSCERIPAATVIGAESPGSQSSFPVLRGFPTVTVVEGLYYYYYYYCCCCCCLCCYYFILFCFCDEIII